MKKSFVNLLYALAALCFVGLFCSCSDEKNETAAPDETGGEESISVSVLTLDLTPKGTAKTISVFATGSWTVECPYWMSVNPSSGTGNADVEVSAESNSGTSAKARTGSLKFTLDSDGSSAYVLVNQDSHDGVMRILTIGNSLSEDCVEQYLWDLFNAADMEAVIGHLYVAGCDLATHYEYAMQNIAGYSYRKIVDGTKTTTADATMLYGILDEEWDYICFSQRGYLNACYDYFFPYLPGLIDYANENATNPDMEIALHMPWAYPYGSDTLGCGQIELYYMIIDAIPRVAEELGIEIVVPSGTAIQNGRNTYMGNTFNRDTQHLELYYGRYTAACAWFEKFSGVDCTTTTYYPSSVTDAQKDLTTHAAHFAVLNPYEINPMTDWQVEP